MLLTASRNNASGGDIEASSKGSDELPTPFQGLGARGLNNLSSKLLLAILPPNTPFFRILLEEIQAERQAAGFKTTVEKALSKMERKVMKEIEKRKIRVSVFEGLKQLLVAGNVLLYVTPSGQMRQWRLDRYVVTRDPAGNVLEIIIKESVDPLTLTPAIRLLVTIHLLGA